MQSSSQIIATNKPTPSFLQAGCPSCRPTNSVKALKGNFFPTNCGLFSSDTEFKNLELSRTQKLLTSSLVVRLHAARNVWNPASPSTDHMEKNATTATSRVNNGRQGNASHIRHVRYQTTFVLSHH